MKIIGGKFKGRAIRMPKGIRPTSDKVRQALFEILKGRIEGAGFLDLYCGSGAVGIEAFSRGGGRITFVDNNPACILAVRENLERFDILDSSCINIYDRSALKALELFQGMGVSFDIVFLDPPYYKGIARNTLIAISDYDILTRNAIIVAEIYKKDILPDNIGALKKTRTSIYGDTKLEFFKHD